jgi:hypothetical protein
MHKLMRPMSLLQELLSTFLFPYIPQSLFFLPLYISPTALLITTSFFHHVDLIINTL